MIKETLLRLVIAWTMAAAGVGLLANDLNNLLGIALFGLGFVWGTLLLFFLSFQLLVYGLSGIIHDIDENRKRDRWNRW